MLLLGEGVLQIIIKPVDADHLASHLVTFGGSFVILFQLHLLVFYLIPREAEDHAYRKNIWAAYLINFLLPFSHGSIVFVGVSLKLILASQSDLDNPENNDIVRFFSVILMITSFLLILQAFIHDLGAGGFSLNLCFASMPFLFLSFSGSNLNGAYDHGLAIIIFFAMFLVGCSRCNFITNQMDLPDENKQVQDVLENPCNVECGLIKLEKLVEFMKLQSEGKCSVENPFTSEEVKVLREALKELDATVSLTKRQFAEFMPPEEVPAAVEIQVEAVVEPKEVALEDTVSGPLPVKEVPEDVKDTL